MKQHEVTSLLAFLMLQGHKKPDYRLTGKLVNRVRVYGETFDDHPHPTDEIIRFLRFEYQMYIVLISPNKEYKFLTNQQHCEYEVEKAALAASRRSAKISAKKELYEAVYRVRASDTGSAKCRIPKELRETRPFTKADIRRNERGRKR